LLSRSPPAPARALDDLDDLAALLLQASRARDVFFHHAADDATRDALAELEERTAVAALLVLDRAFVHRLRAVEGKDTNPLTEVGLIATSLVEHDGVMTAVKGIKYLPGSSVLGIAPGDRIRPGVGDAEKLTRAFLAELEARFLDA